MGDVERIRWAPRVQPQLIKRLYEGEAAGLLDEELLEDVGLRLLDRCRSVILVSRAEVECPRCYATVAIGFGRANAQERIVCPATGCGWYTTPREWHHSWQGRQLIGAKALPAFEDFVAAYPRASDARQRLMLIDQLLHAFHWIIGTEIPARSVANNLIEGSHEQALALLDGLAYGDHPPADVLARRQEWRARVEAMWAARRGG